MVTVSFRVVTLSVVTLGVVTLGIVTLSGVTLTWWCLERRRGDTVSGDTWQRST